MLDGAIETEASLSLINNSITDFSTSNYKNLKSELIKLSKAGGILIVRADTFGIKFSRELNDYDILIDLGGQNQFDTIMIQELYKLNYILSDGYLIKTLDVSFINSNIDQFTNECKFIFEKGHKFLSKTPFLFEDFEETDTNVKTPTNDKGGKSNNFKLVWFIIGIIALIAFYNYTVRPNSQTTENNNLSTSDNLYHANIKVGETLNSDMFDITVHKVSISNKVNVGNEYLDLKSEDGISYLVFNVTFKNVDKESRTIIDGELLINYNGKDYTFDKSETVMAPGWGLFLDQINPLTSKTTNLVYKIPSELKGEIFWHPGRTGDNDKILLGNIE